MNANGWRSKVEFEDRVISNCSACGLPVEQMRMRPKHTPEPESEEDRCHSRPKKYSHLRCMYAAGHECAHTAKVVGTGTHFWSDRDSA